MRRLICLCLATGLLAGEPPLPGRDQAFRSRILGDTAGGLRPWNAYRTPDDTPSAVVEVVGELTQEELRQVTFQDFLVWFREDLKRFWLAQGSSVPAETWASGPLPVNRYGGNPVPQAAPLLRVGF